MEQQRKDYLEQAMITSDTLTDVDTFKVLGSNTTVPANQVIVGSTFRTLYNDAAASNSVSVGTVNATYGTVVEEGNGSFHKSTITLSGAFSAIAGGANLAVGRLIYTLPAGVIKINSVFLNGLALQETQSNINTDTPDVGIGTTIGSGAVALLNGTPAFEDMLTGQTFTDCDGTAERVGVPTPLADAIITAIDNHTVYLNIADGWAVGGDAALGFSGDVVITWEFLS